MSSGTGHNHPHAGPVRGDEKAYAAGWGSIFHIEDRGRKSPRAGQVVPPGPPEVVPPGRVSHNSYRGVDPPMRSAGQRRSGRATGRTDSDQRDGRRDKPKICHHKNANKSDPLSRDYLNRFHFVPSCLVVKASPPSGTGHDVSPRKARRNSGKTEAPDSRRGRLARGGRVGGRVRREAERHWPVGRDALFQLGVTQRNSWPGALAGR